MARRPLDRPPSDRYRDPNAGAGGEIGIPPGSEMTHGPRGDDPDRRTAAPELQAAVVAIVGAAALVVLGGVLALISGQLFVAGVTAALIGLLLAGSSRPRPWVRRTAVIVAVAVVIVGAVGSWLIGLAEGGNLGLLDFLWATTGVLVPAELVIAAVAAVWGAGAGPIRP